MPAVPDFDLQSHSRHSDGELSPAEVVAEAAGAGVRLLALTDHDTVDGVEEALAAGAEYGTAVVPAVELSAIDPGGAGDVHVLGYRIDHRSPGLLERLETFRADRELRAERIASRLEELGFALERAPLQARRDRGDPIGRPHLAAAVVGHPDNAERVRSEGVGEPGAFIEAYLVPGAPAFLPRLTPTVAEAIGAIHDAGGLAVWAHPFWDVDADAEVLETIDRFHALGVDGVEVFYPAHSAEQTGLLADRCARLALLQTGSADFHGPSHPQFNRFRAFELHGRRPVLGAIAPAEA